MTLVPSLNADRALPGERTGCSWQGGWRALLLRSYDEPGTIEAFTTAPTSDQLIVLMTAGRYTIERYDRGHWRSADYTVGSLGMTAPHDTATLRWRGGELSSVLQLHLPDATLRAAGEALWGAEPSRVQLPGHLLREDSAIQHVMLAMQQAMREGAPDVYAETAAAFLAMHLLHRHGSYPAAAAPHREDARLRRVDVFMREHLSAKFSLEDLAAEAGLSRFHLLRSFKRVYGETPFRRLTRLRIDHARRLLAEGRQGVVETALSCGYDNPSHFALAFRRLVGVSPSAYRASSR